MNGKLRFYDIGRRRELGFSNERATREAIIGSTDFMQRLKLEAKLDLHRGCVNTICWNDSGYRILSGADDKTLCISDPYQRKKLTAIASGHRANIFSAKFMPCCNDSQIVSCSGDGQIAFNDVDNTSQHGQHMFNCHYGTAYEVVTVPNDPYSFLSCGEDGTVRWFDLRIKNRCMKEECREDVLINCRRAVTSLAINPIMPYHLGVGCSDSSVRVYDRRMLGTRSTGNYSGRGVQGMFCRFCPPHLQNKYSRPTSLQYSAAGSDLLVSYSSDYIYLFTTEGVKKEVLYERQEGSSEAGLEASGGAALLDDADENPVVNPIKRLRLRGDWSDTGPKARPRGEQAESQPRLTIIQRMSEMLTRWLDDTTSSHARRAAAASTSASAEASSSQDQPPSNRPGPSSAQQAGSRFSSLQRTSTEEQAASPAVQQKLKDAMTSRIKAKKQSASNHDEASCEGTTDAASSQSPPQNDEITTSGGPSSTHDSTSEMPWQSSKEADGSLSSSRNESDSLEQLAKGPSQSKGQKSLSGDDEIVQAGSSEGIGAIASSVQSCMQITPRDSRPEGGEESDTEDCGTNSLDKICVDSTQECDSTSAKTDSKKRKRSPNSSASSSSLTDDPAQDREGEDISGKLRSKRNSRSQRKVTREGSEDGSSSSDSDSDKLPKKTSAGDENLGSMQARAADANRDKLDNPASRPHGQDETDSMDSHRRSSTEKYPDAKLDTSEKLEIPCSESLVQEPDIQLESDSMQELKVETEIPPSETSEDLGPIAPQKPSTSDSSDGIASSGIETSEPVRGTSQRSEDSKQVKSEQEGQGVRRQSEIFALRDRMEDTNPQERSTGQFSVISQRQRRVSVSGPPGTPPPGADVASTSGQSIPHPAVENPTEVSVGDTAPVVGGGESPESPSITCSESDSDDDLILRPPRRRRRHRRHESDEEEARRPRPPSVTESRLRELFRARREAREKGEMQLSNVMMPEVKMVYKGHRNSRTMIKQANFWGDNFVLSGSDCGHVFIWDQHTAELVMLLEGDRHVVNCVQPHPFDHLLATSGIDYDVKLWSPSAEVPSVSDDAAEVMRINELMLDETRDTITVPPSFMLRMLASLNHLRAERRRSRESASSSDTTDEDS